MRLLKSTSQLIIGFMLSLLMAVTIAPYFNVQEPSHTLMIGAGILTASLVLVNPPQGSLNALTVNDTSYAGKVLEQFVVYAATQFDTLVKGCINILPGIKKTGTIPVLRVDSFIQAHKETPSFGGNIEVDARTLTPEEFMGYMEFNPRKFEQHWEAVKMNPKLLDAALPKSAESVIVQEVLKGNGSYLDKAIWRSEKDAAAIVTALASGLGSADNNLIFMDGIQRKAYLDADVSKVATPVALTSANIKSKFEALAALFSSEVYEAPNFKYLLAGANRSHYTDAQKAQANKGVGFTKKGEMTFDGKPVEIINGMDANTIAGGRFSRNMESNLWMGVNEVDEEMYLRLMRLANNSEKWFLKMLFKLDVNYALPKELGFYMTKTYV